MTCFRTESAARQLEVEVHDVTHEDRVVDQQIGEPEVARRPFVADTENVQRDTLAPRVVRHLADRLPFGRDAVGQQHDSRRRTTALRLEDVLQPVTQPTRRFASLPSTAARRAAAPPVRSGSARWC